jgi:predicted ABC-type ATPase
MPRIFVIAGPNGAGKTSSASRLLPEEVNCREFVNADAIAAGLSPFAPDAAALQAGRIMLERIHELARKRVDFAFETTLAARGFVPMIRAWRAQGYEVDLIYLWLENVEIALQRVASRVRIGGHNVPEAVVRRRYVRSLQNLFRLYMPIVDRWVLYDNSDANPRCIAFSVDRSEVCIEDAKRWDIVKRESQ